jgi:hypothetical protein
MDRSVAVSFVLLTVLIEPFCDFSFPFFGGLFPALFSETCTDAAFLALPNILDNEVFAPKRLRVSN